MMADKALTITTQIAAPHQSGSHSTNTNSANDALTSTESAVEDYTIKCICEWDQDDGTGIQCDICDTWQHLECFYPGQAAEASKDDFLHSCADCKPRPLDRQRAIEYQKTQRQSKAEGGDKKSKRASSSKTQKRKTKPSELLVNGQHGRDDHANGSPQDHPPHTKKGKGHRHRESVSTQSQSKHSPHYHSRQPSHTHPPSPAQTPPDLPQDFQLYRFSELFKSVYNNLPVDFATADSSAGPLINTIANVEVANRMSSWLTNDEKLMIDVGQSRNDAFQYLKAPADTISMPQLKVEHELVSVDGTIIRLPTLHAATTLKSGIVGELYGQISLQSDYISAGEHQWDAEYNHPKPFFFFLSPFPLVMDTRRDRSNCRYVRRSCSPNTALETYIDSSGPMGYHFWLVSDHPIAPNEQITIPWDFHFKIPRYNHFLNIGEEYGHPVDDTPMTDEEYDYLSRLTRTVLSDHGGCACGLKNDCSFVRFHRNYHGRAHAPSNAAKVKKGSKKQMKQNPVSPSSTGRATNSRAASEAHQDQSDENGRRSRSRSSARSKPSSRDQTPVNGFGEPAQLLSSHREERKIAATIASFEQMEQEKTARKRKRASDGATNSPVTQTVPKARKGSIAPRAMQHKSVPNATEKRQYTDASTSRRQSGSPRSIASPNIVPPRLFTPQRPTSARPSYVNASTMVNMDEDAWYNGLTTSSIVRKPILSLAQKLLKSRQLMKAQRSILPSTLLAENQDMVASPTVSMDLHSPVTDERGQPDSPLSAMDRHGSIASLSPSVEISDVNMTDAPPIAAGNLIKPPPPRPAPLALNNEAAIDHLHKVPELRVQLPPSVPTFSPSFMIGTPSPSITPASAAGSNAHSPFSLNNLSAVHGVNSVNSPVRTTKKLSLGDYKRKREEASKLAQTASKSPAGISPT